MLKQTVMHPEAQRKFFLRVSLGLAMSGYLKLNNEQLRKMFEECTAMAAKLQDTASLIVAHLKLAEVYFKLSEIDKAIMSNNNLLSFFKINGFKREEGQVYGMLGSCFHALAQFDKAVEHHEKHLMIAKQIGDKAGEGCACGNIGNCYLFVGQYARAVEHYEKALTIAKQIGDKEGEGSSYGNLGMCYRSLGQYRKAIELHENHLAIAKQIGDKEGEGSAYGNLGVCYDSLGQYDEAIDHHEKHLTIARQLGDKAGEESVYGSLGVCYHSLGQYDKAIDHHKKDLTIAKQIGNKAGEGQAYGNLGICYDSLGKYDEAINHHEKHLTIAKQIGDKAGEGNAYGCLGISYVSLGQYDKGIDCHEEHLAVAKQTGDKAGEGRAHCNIGICYRSLKQYNKAIGHHEKYLTIAKLSGDKAGELLAYGNLGSCYLALSQYSQAIDHFETALAIARQIRYKEGERAANSNLGSCYFCLGQYDKAIDLYEKSLTFSKKVASKPGEGHTYGTLGSHYEKYFAEQIGDKSKGTILYNMGSCHRCLEQFDKAEIKLKESLQCFEEMFKNTPQKDELKISVRETFFECYKVLVDVLVTQGKTNEALYFSEKGRARALVELMHFKGFLDCSKLRDETLDLVAILRVVKELRSTVLFLTLSDDSVYTWIIQRNGCINFKRSYVHKSQNEVVSLPKQISALTLEIRGSCFPGECEDRSLSRLYVQKELEQNDENSFPKSCPSSVVPNIELANRCTTEPFHSDISYRNIIIEEDGVEVSALQKLYQIILAPAQEHIEGKEVVIIPEGPLHLVPFAALVDEHEHYVAESLRVRIFPSLTTAKMILENVLKSNEGLKPLIVGDPDTGVLPRLPCANKEAQIVAKLFNTEPLIGKEATKEKVLLSVESASFMHISAHGDMERGEVFLARNQAENINPGDVNNTKQPQKDNMLMLADLEHKRLSAKLVVLSCCHSARGKITADGVVGVARAFLGAGARSVLVALWAIADDATLYFMERFYEHLTQGESAGESLNKAMEAMRESGIYNDHQHWAPFVLIGDDVSVC